jgi:uncharacterized cupin superfamily protein
MKYIVKTQELEWQPKFFSNEEKQYGEFKALWKEHECKQFEVRITRVLPGGVTTKYHTHTKEEEWFYVLNGTSHINIEGEWHQIEAGDSIFKPPGIYHTFRNLGDEPCDIIMMGTHIEGSKVHRIPEPDPPDSESNR